MESSKPTVSALWWINTQHCWAKVSSYCINLMYFSQLLPLWRKWSRWLRNGSGERRQTSFTNTRVSQSTSATIVTHSHRTSYSTRKVVAKWKTTAPTAHARHFRLKLELNFSRNEADQLNLISPWRCMDVGCINIKEEFVTCCDQMEQTWTCIDPVLHIFGLF